MSTYVLQMQIHIADLLYEPRFAEMGLLVDNCDKRWVRLCDMWFNRWEVFYKIAELYKCLECDFRILRYGAATRNGSNALVEIRLVDFNSIVLSEVVNDWMRFINNMLKEFEGFLQVRAVVMIAKAMSCEWLESL